MTIQSLFRPLTLGGVEIANRLVLSPMAVLQPRPDGMASEQTVAFLEARARGGVGMIVIGGCSATSRMWEETPYRPLLRLDDDAFVPGLRRVTDAVHAHGTKIFAEVMAGFGAMGKPSKDWPLIAASPKNVVMRRDHFPRGMLVPADRVLPMPREATTEEIGLLEREAAASAERVRRAGFDGVEIAAHMNYFLASFLSPRTNWRTDEYGGSLKNRARVLVNIVRLIREQVGTEFPIGLRLSANEHVDGGQGPEEYATLAALVERGGLDYVSLVDGCYESMDLTTPATDANVVDHGEAECFRRALSVPLIVGSVHDHERAAEIVAAGQADAIMFARPLLADPEYPNKVRSGRAQDIVCCDRDNYCVRRLVMNMPVRCSVNPRMGRESRAPGARPPASRVLKAPVENAVLSITGSRKVMGLVGKAAARAAKSG